MTVVIVIKPLILLLKLN